LYGAAASIGVVGLGAGTVSCYRQDGQSWRFFEIDPLMVSIARDDSRFHFLSDCAPDVPIDVGDARVELTKLPSDSFDVLAVDAFSSDAIPMHLMTVEAFDLYDRVVRDDGVVLVHITNRYIDLEPVLRSLTQREGWHAAVRQDEAVEQPGTGSLFPSKWVALTRDPAVLDRVMGGTGAEWRALSDHRAPRAWTDDFASVLPLLK
jgi:spermidine synthase